MAKRIFLYFTFIFALVSCESSTEPSANSPIANAGPDQTSKVGSYITLDGTGSILGDGGIRLTYIWKADENNPDDVNVYQVTETQKIGFIVEGEYKFYLQVYNGYHFSEWDEIVVIVSQRDNTILEDPSLELCVRYELEEPDAEITPTLLETLDELYCKINTSLNGIEYCTNLTSISINSYTTLSISPLTGLANLIDLHIDGLATISDISQISSLTQLKRLRISGITNFDDISVLGTLTQLEELHIPESGIEDISIITQMPLMEELYLSDNIISEIDALQNLSNLKWVDLFYNQITNIKALVDNPYIGNGIHFSLYGNPLDSISINQYIPELESRGVSIGYFID